jgi:hypothetical protein
MTKEVGIFMNKFLVSVIFIVVFSANSLAQSIVFKDANSDYTFELPEVAWKMVVKPTSTNPNVEYVYGDRLDGHLEIRKLSLGQDELISDLITREQEQKLQFVPGYIGGKEETFAGNLKGKVYNFEFTKAGKNMSGRFYFLRGEGKTIYQLRFTGYRDKLRSIRNQVDSIARTFNIKGKSEKDG